MDNQTINHNCIYPILFPQFAAIFFFLRWLHNWNHHAPYLMRGIQTLPINAFIILYESFQRNFVPTRTDPIEENFLTKFLSKDEWKKLIELYWIFIYTFSLICSPYIFDQICMYFFIEQCISPLRLRFSEEEEEKKKISQTTRMFHPVHSRGFDSAICENSQFVVI